MKTSTHITFLVALALLVFMPTAYANTNNSFTKENISKVASRSYVYTIIDVKGSRFSDQMMIFSIPECTRNFDNGWDGRKLFGNALTPQLFAMEADGIYQINSINDIDQTNLGFLAGEDTSYKLTFTHVNLEQRYSELYLLDLKNDTVVDITQTGTQYVFTAEKTLAPEKRFEILTSKPYSAKEITTKNNTLYEDELNIFNVNGAIYVNNNSANAGRLFLFDLSGRIVEEWAFNANEIFTLPINLPVGIYVAKVNTNSQKLTVKLIIR